MLLLLGPLAACGAQREPLTVRSVQEQVSLPPVVEPLPPPPALELIPLRWLVLSPGRLPDGSDWSFVALTPEDFENLLRNLAETARWAEEARTQLDRYAAALRK